MTGEPEATRLVTFRLGEQLFAAGIDSVERVLRHESTRSIPDMPDWVEGVIDYRGAVVPVVDLRRRFGMEPGPRGAHARLIICSTSTTTAALLVDAVLDVRPVAPGDLSPSPALFRGLAGEYLKGLTRRQGQLVVVLDVERLLASRDPLVLTPSPPGPPSDADGDA